MTNATHGPLTIPSQALLHTGECRFCGRDYHAHLTDDNIEVGGPCPADDCPSHHEALGLPCPDEAA